MLFFKATFIYSDFFSPSIKLIISKILFLYIAIILLCRKISIYIDPSTLRSLWVKLTVLKELIFKYISNLAPNITIFFFYNISLIVISSFFFNKIIFENNFWILSIRKLHQMILKKPFLFTFLKGPSYILINLLSEFM